MKAPPVESCRLPSSVPKVYCPAMSVGAASFPEKPAVAEATTSARAMLRAPVPPMSALRLPVTPAVRPVPSSRLPLTVAVLSSSMVKASATASTEPAASTVMLMDTAALSMSPSLPMTMQVVGLVTPELGREPLSEPTRLAPLTSNPVQAADRLNEVTESPVSGSRKNCAKPRL